MVLVILGLLLMISGSVLWLGFCCNGVDFWIGLVGCDDEVEGVFQLVLFFGQGFGLVLVDYVGDVLCLNFGEVVFDLLYDFVVGDGCFVFVVLVFCCCQVYFDDVDVLVFGVGNLFVQCFVFFELVVIVSEDSWYCYVCYLVEVLLQEELVVVFVGLYEGGQVVFVEGFYNWYGFDVQLLLDCGFVGGFVYDDWNFDDVVQGILGKDCGDFDQVDGYVGVCNMLGLVF